jgi:hypothetical protein
VDLGGMIWPSWRLHSSATETETWRTPRRGSVSTSFEPWFHGCRRRSRCVVGADVFDPQQLVEHMPLQKVRVESLDESRKRRVAARTRTSDRRGRGSRLLSPVTGTPSKTEAPHPSKLPGERLRGLTTRL